MRYYRRVAMFLIILLVAMLLLEGCFNVATSGAQAVYNRHSLGRNLKDQYITMQANKAINVKTSAFSDANIVVATMNGEVLIAGQTPEAWQKQKVEEIVRQIPDVQSVYNLVEVESPSSTLTRFSDALITAKVKARLIASNDVDASQVKVVTENGRVFLMGTLPPEEANAAIDIASSTTGVRSVVKIFSYITISKKLTA